MKLFEFTGPALLIVIMVSFTSQQLGNNNPGHREVEMQEISSHAKCKVAAEFILQTNPGAVDVDGRLTRIAGAQNSHRQTIDVGCVPL